MEKLISNKYKVVIRHCKDAWAEKGKMMGR